MGTKKGSKNKLIRVCLDNEISWGHERQLVLKFNEFFLTIPKLVFVLNPYTNFIVINHLIIVRSLPQRSWFCRIRISFNQNCFGVFVNFFINELILPKENFFTLISVSLLTYNNKIFTTTTMPKSWNEYHLPQLPSIRDCKSRNLQKLEEKKIAKMKISSLPL